MQHFMLASVELHDVGVVWACWGPTVWQSCPPVHQSHSPSLVLPLDMLSVCRLYQPWYQTQSNTSQLPQHAWMHPVRSCGLVYVYDQLTQLVPKVNDPLRSFTVFLPSTNPVTWHAEPRGLRKDLFCKGSEYLMHFPTLCMRLPAFFISSSTFALVFPSLIWSPVEAIHTDLCIFHQFPFSQGLTFLILSQSS